MENKSCVFLQRALLILHRCCVRNSLVSPVLAGKQTFGVRRHSSAKTGMQSPDFVKKTKQKGVILTVFVSPPAASLQRLSLSG